MKKPEILPKDIIDLILPRLYDEFKAFYFYRSAANWCQNVGFMLASKYFENESNDELSHAKGIESFLTDWNVVPDLGDIKKPELTFKSLMDVIEKAYKMEYSLYEEYEDTSIKILEKKDVCAFDFLQKYRSIQTKSVAEYSDMINKIEGCSGSKFEMLLLEEVLFGEEE